MGQLFSSPRRDGHVEPGLVSNTSPTGTQSYVLLEQPGIDISEAQSNPSKEQSEDSSTTSKKKNDMISGQTEVDVLQAGLLQVMCQARQLAPMQGSTPADENGHVKSDAVVLLPHVVDAQAAFLKPDAPVPEVNDVVVICFMAGRLEEPGSIVATSPDPPGLKTGCELPAADLDSETGGTWQDAVSKLFPESPAFVRDAVDPTVATRHVVTNPVDGCTSLILTVSIGYQQTDRWYGDAGPPSPQCWSVQRQQARSAVHLTPPLLLTGLALGLQEDLVSVVHGILATSLTANGVSDLGIDHRQPPRSSLKRPHAALYRGRLDDDDQPPHAVLAEARRLTASAVLSFGDHLGRLHVAAATPDMSLKPELVLIDGKVAFSGLTRFVRDLAAHGNLDSDGERMYLSLLPLHAAYEATFGKVSPLSLCLHHGASQRWPGSMCLYACHPRSGARLDIGTDESFSRAVREPAATQYRAIRDRAYEAVRTLDHPRIRRWQATLQSPNCKACDQPLKGFDNGDTTGVRRVDVTDVHHVEPISQLVTRVYGHWPSSEIFLPVPNQHTLDPDHKSYPHLIAALDRPHRFESMHRQCHVDEHRREVTGGASTMPLPASGVMPNARAAWMLPNFVAGARR